MKHPALSPEGTGNGVLEITESAFPHVHTELLQAGEGGFALFVCLYKADKLGDICCHSLIRLQSHPNK